MSPDASDIDLSPELRADAQKFAPRGGARRALLFARLGMGLTGALVAAVAISALVQFGGVAYLTAFVPSPVPSRVLAALPDRFVQLLVEEPEDAPEVPEVEDEPPAEPIALALPEPAPAPEPEVAAEPEPEPEPEAESADDAPAEADEPAVDGGDGGGIDAVGIGGGDGGTAPPVASGTGGARRAEAPRARPAERRTERREDATRSEEDRERVARLEDTARPPCAQMRREPSVPYPEDLRAAAVHGLVQIQCIVTESGHLRGCRHRGGPEELFRVALPAVEQWRCTPAETSDGARVAAPFNFRIPFRLEA